MWLRIIVVSFISGILAFIITISRKRGFRVVSAIDVAASREKVLKFLADLKNWPLFSPPYSANEGFVAECGSSGKRCSWINRKGEAGVVITIAREDESSVHAVADWRIPFVAMAHNEFRVQQLGSNVVRVTWTWTTELDSFFVKAFVVIVGEQRVFAKHFHESLNRLSSHITAKKEIVE
jgi:hypothetical protein